MRITIPVLGAFLLLASCQERQVPVRDTIPYVKQLAVDTAGTYSLLASYRSAGSVGSIAVIGEPEAAWQLSSRLLAADEVDNIDGKPRPDRLPDFAGESFDILMDQYNAPYTRMAASSPDSLREIAVRNAVISIDSVAYSNALDPMSRLRKSRAKVFVLANSLLTEYGRFDIDTLFKMTGREALILTPVEAMLETAAKAGCRSVAVWAPQEARSAYEHAAQAYPQMTVTVVSTTGNGMLRPAFRDMLRIFRGLKPKETLDAVLLDSFTANLEELSAEQEHIHRQITEEDMAFDRTLTPHFRFIEPNASLTSALYRLLRERNLFTHDIAYPSVRYYQTEENRDGEYVPVEVSAEYISAHANPDPYVPDLD
ncbi:MAG: hypothetical protein IJ893_04510 [Bacteroidales bacterium]|nr:hypothetical protein [Bacteroidales bacterium]MBR2227114.1 hypothetical protein [Bacteroidales bacterium]MBR4688606.1 hypothetical protein [Bacteroidales bacterium]